MLKNLHFIVTRLMIYNKNWGSLKNQTYLDSRVKLFNNFYTKSMISQTNQRFVNIFLIDKEYEHLDYSGFNFEKLNYKIIFSSNPSKVKSYLKLHFGIEEKDKIITTRIDSDDIIKKNFVDELHLSLKNYEKNCIVDFRKTLFLSSKTFFGGFAKYNYNSMFLSTFFSFESFEKYYCYAKGHGQLNFDFENKKIIEDIGGACICHENNVSNSIRGSSIKEINLKEYFPWI